MQLHESLRDVLGDDWGLSRSSSRLIRDLKPLLKYVLAHEWLKSQTDHFLPES